MSKRTAGGKARIDSLGETSDTLTSRGGLALFARYLQGTGLLEELGRLFGSLRRGSKGQPVAVLFQQILCFFMDGMSRHLVRFDALKRDEGYAAGIEMAPEQMASSHMIKRNLAALIRKELGAEVPIVIRMDSGFFDQKLFETFEELGIGYICSGKLLADVVGYVAKADRSQWSEHRNGTQLWAWLEFGDRRGSWKRGRRAIYTRPVYENDGQGVLEFARPDNVIYTNLGLGEKIDEWLAEAGLAEWLTPGAIIEQHHSRGADELVHRSLKEFASETLPFRAFAANSAWYYTMLVAHFLFECFKRDVSAPVVPVTARPTRLRRELIDFAAKIVCTGGQRLLKVTAAVMKHLGLEELWARSGKPPQIAWA
jgi:hypothetical protein